MQIISIYTNHITNQVYEIIASRKVLHFEHYFDAPVAPIEKFSLVSLDKFGQVHVLPTSEHLSIHNQLIISYASNLFALAMSCNYLYIIPCLHGSFQLFTSNHFTSTAR